MAAAPAPEQAAPAQGGGDQQAQFSDMVTTLNEGLGVFVSVLEKGGAPEDIVGKAAELQSTFQSLVEALTGGGAAAPGGGPTAGPAAEQAPGADAQPAGPQVRG